MARDNPGDRVRVTAVRALVHGQFCVVNNRVGQAWKVTQLTRYQDPTQAAVRNIAVGEEFTLVRGGTHDLPLTGPVAAAVLGSRVWINPTTDALILDAAPPAAGSLPLGVVDFIDVARTPDVADLNLDAWQAFAAHA